MSQSSTKITLLQDDACSGPINCDGLIKSLSSEIERLDSYLIDRKFLPNDHVRRYAICYAAQCLDFSKALLALQNQEALISQYTVLRSLFEAYIRFTYLIAEGKNCKEIQIQRLQNLQLEAFNAELRGIKEAELDISDKSERRGWLERQIDALKTDGADQVGGVKGILKTLTSAEHTNGWYSFFQMFSAKAHSRLTDLERVYGLDGLTLKFSATQSSEECHFIFQNAQNFLFHVGCGITTLWGEEISVA
jgi:hypothetical protein